MNHNVRLVRRCPGFDWGKRGDVQPVGDTRERLASVAGDCSEHVELPGPTGWIQRRAYPG